MGAVKEKYLNNQEWDSDTELSVCNLHPKTVSFSGITCEWCEENHKLNMKISQQSDKIIELQDICQDLQGVVHDLRKELNDVTRGLDK
jgi:tRNA A37 threonylcarbamoyltransferase TsaD